MATSAPATSPLVPDGLTGLAATLWADLVLPGGFQLSTVAGQLNTPLPVPTAPTDRSQWSTLTWAILLLAQLPGVPLTMNNVINVMTWMASEEPAGSWLSWNNPLNATAGATQMTVNGVTTPGYSDPETGINATAGMIQQSNMSAILAALQQNASYSTFKSAVVSSPWASSHYGGGADFSSSPLVAWATGSGSNPTGILGQVGASIPGVSEFSGLASAASGLISDVTNVSWWKRVGVFLLGAGLVGIGAYLFAQTTDTGSKITGGAKSAGELAAAA